MFSFIRTMLVRALSFDHLSERVEQLESKLQRFEKLADENEALWDFLDKEKGIDPLWESTTEQFEEEFPDILLRNMKPYGDA